MTWRTRLRVPCRDYSRHFVGRAEQRLSPSVARSGDAARRVRAPHHHRAPAEVFRVAAGFEAGHEWRYSKAHAFSTNRTSCSSRRAVCRAGSRNERRSRKNGTVHSSDHLARRGLPESAGRLGQCRDQECRGHRPWPGRIPEDQRHRGRQARDHRSGINAGFLRLRPPGFLERERGLRHADGDLEETLRAIREPRQPQDLLPQHHQSAHHRRRLQDRAGRHSPGRGRRQGAQPDRDDRVRAQLDADRHADHFAQGDPGSRASQRASDAGLLSLLVGSQQIRGSRHAQTRRARARAFPGHAGYSQGAVRANHAADSGRRHCSSGPDSAEAGREGL